MARDVFLEEVVYATEDIAKELEGLEFEEEC